VAPPTISDAQVEAPCPPPHTSFVGSSQAPRGEQQSGRETSSEGGVVRNELNRLKDENVRLRDKLVTAMDPGLSSMEGVECTGVGGQSEEEVKQRTAIIRYQRDIVSTPSIIN